MCHPFFFHRCTRLRAPTSDAAASEPGREFFAMEKTLKIQRFEQQKWRRTLDFAMNNGERFLDGGEKPRKMVEKMVGWTMKKWWNAWIWPVKTCWSIDWKLL